MNLSTHYLGLKLDNPLIVGARNDRTTWMEGGASPCANLPEVPPWGPWHIVLLGAPGVGKGTQAELLCERLPACHLSTGDVFRAAAGSPGNERSPALREALEFMRRGELVPDSTVLAMIAERRKCLRCAGGFVLDGFPRTVAQAEALERLLEEEGVTLDVVFNYELPTEELATRVGGRRYCPACKATFHVSGRPPLVEGVCDLCGGPLRVRDDDHPDAVPVRLKAYEGTAAPLVEYYLSRGLLVSVPASGTPEEVFGRAWDRAADARIRRI